MTSVTIVVPTFNESGNVSELLRRLDAVRDRARVDEIIFVDDSTDDTPAAIATASVDGGIPVRMFHRVGLERVGGLSGAVVAGIGWARSPWVVVMDADLQHPPEDVPRLVAAATASVDAVVASRYCVGGGAHGLSSGFRRLVSTSSTRLAGLMFPVRLRRCTDSMTGFFAIRRDAIDLERMRPRGFKILLEILVRHRMRVAEVPFVFALRQSGESKATMSQGVRFVSQLVTLRWHMWWATKRSREMVTFGAIGVLNVVLDVGVFNALLLGLRHDAAVAKALSTTVATVSSYLMNRHWTWRDRAQSGIRRELPLFAVLSAVGLGISEACLWISHNQLGYTSALADNIAANGVGLALGMTWRFLTFKRWVFTAPTVPVDPTSSAQPTRFEWGLSRSRR